MADREILYSEALDEGGHLVEISDSLEHGHTYRCPNCNEPMTPVLGDIRVHHFRHIGTECKYDRYLHACAEQTFIEEYQKCLDEGLPFYLEMDVPVKCNRACVLSEHLDCKERLNRKLFDLTKEFKKVSQEVRVDTGDKKYRRPDILLERENGTSLWVEICVTHETTPLDLAGLSGIIEIKINSKDDINRIIRGHRIVQSDDRDSWVRLHKFSFISLDEPMQKTPPCQKYYVFDVKEGRYFGTGRILESVPRMTNEITRRIVLYLNWKRSSFSCDNAPTRYKLEDLDVYCRKRLSNVKSGDLLLPALVKEVYSAPVKRSGSHTKPGSVNNNISRPAPVTQYQVDRPVRAINKANWIDLGLPSGTLWSDCDGEVEAPMIEGYEATPVIPKRGFIEELKACCDQFISEDSRHIVIKSRTNGQSIMLHSGDYELSDKPKEPGVYYVKIYALVGKNYLHIIDDDHFSANCDVRYILLKQ